MVLVHDINTLRDGPLCRTDARVKLVFVMALTFSMAATQTFWGAAVGILLGSSVLALARPRAGEVFRRLYPTNIFLGLVSISLLFTYPGDSWAAWAAVSVEGAEKALLIVVKGNAILLMVLALILSTPIVQLTHALRDLGCPEKITLLLGFTYRQIFLVAEEMDRMRDVARLRCFTPATDKHTYRTFAWFIAQSLLRASDRAERIRWAMIMRGFDGHFRSLHITRTFGPREICACAAAIIFSCLLVMLDRSMVP